MTRVGFCHELVDALTGARHFDILPAGGPPRLRPIDEIEARANTLREPATERGRGPDSVR